jgi:hypothetical protein
VLAEARAAGSPLRLVGRRREALEELALAGDELRVVDAAAPGDAFAGCAAVVSCAGPFLRIGEAPVAAAVAAGATYLDSSGEQAWARLLFERFRDAETPIRRASLLRCVPGDVAAAAAEGLEPLEEIVVACRPPPLRRPRHPRTVGDFGQPSSLAGGRARQSRLGATTRMVVSFGAREVVEFGGAEPATVARRNRRSHRARPIRRGPAGRQPGGSLQRR